MNDNKQLEELRRAGMEWFAEYYLELCNWSLSDGYLVNKMIEEKGYTRPSSRTKVSAGRRIIKAGRGRDALVLIAKSKNDRDVVLATGLLNNPLTGP